MLKNVFLAAASTFAAIPGIAVIMTNIGVPHGMPRYLFGGIIEIVSIYTLLYLRLQRKKIQRISIKNIRRQSLRYLIAFFILLLVYLFLYDYCTIEASQKGYDPTFFPFWTQGELQTFIAEQGSKSAVLDYLGRDRVVELIETENSFPSIVTATCFLLIFVAGVTALIQSFSRIGWKLVKVDAANS